MREVRDTRRERRAWYRLGRRTAVNGRRVLRCAASCGSSVRPEAMDIRVLQCVASCVEEARSRADGRVAAPRPGVDAGSQDRRTTPSPLNDQQARSRAFSLSSA